MYEAVYHSVRKVKEVAGAGPTHSEHASLITLQANTCADAGIPAILHAVAVVVGVVLVAVLLAVLVEVLVAVLLAVLVAVFGVRRNNREIKF